MYFSLIDRLTVPVYKKLPKIDLKKLKKIKNNRLVVIISELFAAMATKHTI